MSTFEKFRHAGCRVKIYPDDHPESPREWDNLGTMVCCHTRYLLGDEPYNWDHVDAQKLHMELAAAGALILPLYLYDHSGITMNTTGFSCPWDSGQVGFIYATREKVRAEYQVTRITKKLRQQVLNLLAAEVETYDQFITGDVWGYVVRDESSGDEESCWGFYGLDSCRQEAKQMSEYLRNRRIGALGEQLPLNLGGAL